ncbi:hypothetical protein M2138_000213 [Dysgonomonadaceae bacterium PH5-43]|nr:hypothetical protein [Dysgonomonadaceae bacterium PH5-43]
MKKTITLVVLALLTLTVQAKSKSFHEQYVSIRTEMEEQDEISFLKMTLNEEDIQKQILKSVNADDETAKVFQEAEQINIAFDMNKEEMLDNGKFKTLLKSYDELIACYDAEIKASFFGKTKKDKVEELIVLLHIDENALVYVNFIFKKAVNVDFLLKDTEALKSVMNLKLSSKTATFD